MYLLNSYQTKWLPNYRNPCTSNLVTDPAHPASKYENCKNGMVVKTQPAISCLPHVYIAGMPKAGTTDLFSALMYHPHIFATQKEPEWWARRVSGELK